MKQEPAFVCTGSCCIYSESKWDSKPVTNDMKRYRYYLINLLILFAPIYGNWDLIMDGQRCTGTVVDILEVKQHLFYETYPIINYRVGEKFYQIRGPENADYPVGTELNLIYSEEEPSEAIIFSVFGFLSQWYSILALVLFVFWNAFYLSFLKDKHNYFDDSKLNHNKLN